MDQSITNILLVFSTLLSPVVALYIQKKINIYQDKINDRKSIFFTLMRTRASTLSTEHIQALNSIDAVFYKSSKKDEEVIEAWKEHHSLLMNNERMSFEQLRIKQQESLANLLNKMSRCLKYGFSLFELKTRTYYPALYNDMDGNNISINKGMAEILSGQKSLRISIQDE